MKDYCTLRPLVVRVQARMFIFWKFDILVFLGTHGPGPMGQGPWAWAREAAIAADQIGVWGRSPHRPYVLQKFKNYTKKQRKR